MERIKRTLRELKLFAVLNFSEDYEIRVHPNLPTACWRYDKKSKKHKILIGLGNGLKEKFEKFPEYMKSFGFHEFSHSLNSQRDLEKINEELKKKNIPFNLYNLLEDARIEHLWRKNFSRDFNWIKYERDEFKKLVREIKEEMDILKGDIEEWKRTGTSDSLGTIASQIFFLFVQTEGKMDLEEELGEKELVGAVKGYYERVINGNNVIEECEKFVDEFGFPTFVPQLLSGYGDMEISEEEFEYYWENAQDIEEGKEGEFCDKKGNREYKEGDLIVELSADKVSIDWNEVEREVNRLIKVFKSYTKKISTQVPSKKLNTKKLALDKEDIYLREQDISVKMKPFTVIVDCSGSMRVMTPVQHFLVAVFSELARRTKTESYLILTKNNEAQLFKLPVSRDVIERIPYDGGSENILGGLREFQRYILKTRYVFVISDMQITDYWKETEKEIKELKKKGIEVIGIYKGLYYREAKRNAKEFFEKYVVTKDTNPIDLLIPILKTAFVC